MKKREKVNLQKAMADYEQRNPKAAKAMRMFDMSLAEYQRLLAIINSPQLTVSSSTTRLDVYLGGQLG